MSSLTIVVPCYNEEEILPITIKRLVGVITDLLSEKKIERGSICFVDDGSSDLTWDIIESSVEKYPEIEGLKLSRNRGHQNALMAGLLSVDSDMVISIDADLQDDVEVISGMVDQYHQGHDIVYGVRRRRESDSRFKKMSAELYYRFLHRMGVLVEFNHADFRLMSRRSIEVLKQYDEVNLFLRGIIPTIGFPSTSVTYDRDERLAGVSKYPLSKMLALAIDGVTSFTSVPLRLISVLGVVVFLGSLLLSLWVLWVRFTYGDAVPGWASSVLPIYFLGGVQLFSIGVVGEYVAKTYMETKRRPRYIIEKIVK